MSIQFLLVSVSLWWGKYFVIGFCPSFSEVEKINFNSLFRRFSWQYFCHVKTFLGMDVKGPKRLDLARSVIGVWRQEAALVSLLLRENERKGVECTARSLLLDALASWRSLSLAVSLTLVPRTFLCAPILTPTESLVHEGNWALAPVKTKELF